MVVIGQPLPPRLLRVFKSILSALESPEGLKPRVLKSLYHVLTSLSLEIPIPCSNSGTPSYLDTAVIKMESKMLLSYFRMISDIIFKELSKKFKQLFSALRDASVVKPSLHPDLWGAAKELNLILRCCLVILNLLEPEQHIIFGKCRVLLALLGRLCSLDLIGDSEKIAFSLKTSREGKYTDDDSATSFSEDFVASFCFLEHSDPCLPFIRQLLEVFLDELLVHRPLRQYFLLVDSVSSESEMLFTSHTNLDDTGCILELLSAHFLLSVSDEQALEKFLNRLFCLHSESSRFPEFSLNAAVLLLHNPIMFSAPKMLQAHLISLVSEPITSALNSKDTRLDHRLISTCLSAFERSVTLYRQHISALWSDPGNDFANSLKFDCRSSFESHILPVTRNKISTLVSKLDNSWHSYLHNMLFKTKADLLAASISFMKGNEHILDEKYKDEISSILNCVIVRALPDKIDNSLLQKAMETGAQDVSLLASILTLMSCSMVQVIRCIRLVKGSFSCKEYDSLVDIICCFQQIDVELPIQKFVYNAIESVPTIHEESKPMLLHFSGVLSLSFNIGFDFLVKGCVFVMIAIMNLFTLEKGTLHELKSSLVSGSESFSSGLTPNGGQEALENPRSLVVASKFQKTRMQSLSMDPSTTDHDALIAESGVGIEDETEETCNGEIFLNCVIQGPSKMQDIHDLADFIECEPGKDYPSLLKNRQIFRKWKSEKMAVLRWKKRKKTWRCIKGRKT